MKESTKSTGLFVLTLGLGVCSLLPVGNHYYGIWDDTDPYWNTTHFDQPECLLAVFGGIILAIGCFIKANESYARVMFPLSDNDYRSQYYFFAFASGLILLSALFNFVNTFNQDVLMNESPDELRGARALQGVVAAVSLLALMWNVSEIKGWNVKNTLVRWLYGVDNTHPLDIKQKPSATLASGPPSQ